MDAADLSNDGSTTCEKRKAPLLVECQLRNRKQRTGTDNSPADCIGPGKVFLCKLEERFLDEFSAGN